MNEMFKFSPKLQMRTLEVKGLPCPTTPEIWDEIKGLGIRQRSTVLFDAKPLKSMPSHVTESLRIST
jgi:hypothetical protein